MSNELITMLTEMIIDPHSANEAKEGAAEQLRNICLEKKDGEYQKDFVTALERVSKMEQIPEPIRKQLTFCLIKAYREMNNATKLQSIAWQRDVFDIETRRRALGAVIGIARRTQDLELLMAVERAKLFQDLKLGEIISIALKHLQDRKKIPLNARKTPPPLPPSERIKTR